jgi:site-specific DNA-adenine methylase
MTLEISGRTETIAFSRWISNWESPSPTTNQGTHELGFQRWFRFKEAFAPSFVKEVIEGLPYKPKKVLDPFGGSGTTAVTCQFLGVQPSVIEVNPFLADLIESKLCAIDLDYFMLVKDEVERQAKKARTRSIEREYTLPPSFIEPGVNGRYIYSLKTAREILALRQAIERVERPEYKRILRVALASILVDTSNCYVNGKGRRYRRSWQTRVAPEVFSSFHDACACIAEDLAIALCRPVSNYSLYRGDCREQLKTIEPGFDFCLFSPPYPNSFDYTDVYNIELWMLGYLTSSQENIALRKSTLRSHVQVAASRAERELKSKHLQSVYKKLDKARGELWDKRIPEMVRDYFADLADIIELLGERLGKGKYVGMVVGDSQYRDIHIGVAKILSELAPSLGFKVESTKRVRSMRSSAQQGGNLKLAESLILLSKI